MEELSERLILGKVYGAFLGFSMLSKFLSDTLQDQFASIQVLSQGFIRLEFSHKDATERCMQLGTKELEGKVVKFLPWFDDFSTEALPMAVGFQIRVQFLDLHPIFQIHTWLAKFGALIGEVQEIEQVGSSYKRLS